MFHPLLDTHSMNYYGGREGGGREKLGYIRLLKKKKKKLDQFLEKFGIIKILY